MMWKLRQHFQPNLTSWIWSPSPVPLLLSPALPRCPASHSPTLGSTFPQSRCRRCRTTPCSRRPPGWPPPLSPGLRSWTSRLTSPLTWRSSRPSPRCSSRSGSSWATLRGTWAWPWGNSMVMTSRRQQSQDSRLSTSHSRTCANSSPCCKNGLRTLRCLRITTPRCSTRRPHSAPPRRLWPGGGRRGPASTTPWGSRWRGPSTPTPSRAARRSSTFLTGSAWRRRWSESGFAIEDRRKRGWTPTARTPQGAPPSHTSTPPPPPPTPWPRPRPCPSHQPAATRTTTCPPTWAPSLSGPSKGDSIENFELSDCLMCMIMI